MNRPLRVAAIQDLSTFGRCALSVAMPVLSSMGVQVCPVPTMLLSTHTGGFTDIRKMDCADFSIQCARHYAELQVALEGVYSGYLGDEQQIAGVLEFYNAYPGALKVADPVLGDNGRLYNGITQPLISGMGRILARADVITPNVTEAALLTGQPYRQEYESAAMIALCRGLSELTKAQIVITGVTLAGRGRGNVCHMRDGRTVFLPAHYRHTCFDGTGDIFASVLTGALLKKEPLFAAVHMAAGFVEHCIDLSAGSGEPNRDGVFLETALPWLQTARTATEEYLELTEE